MRITIDTDKITAQIKNGVNKAFDLDHEAIRARAKRLKNIRLRSPFVEKTNVTE